jgi:hypothetical protein
VACIASCRKQEVTAALSSRVQRASSSCHYFPARFEKPLPGLLTRALCQYLSPRFEQPSAGLPQQSSLPRMKFLDGFEILVPGSISTAFCLICTSQFRVCSRLLFYALPIAILRIASNLIPGSIKKPSTICAYFAFQLSDLSLERFR